MAKDAIDILQQSQPVVNNKVELLRPLERTVGQFDKLIAYPYTGGLEPNKDNLPCSEADDEYTEKDKTFLEQFKKIYHLGSGQLEQFIDNLSDNGQDIDPESLLYYIDQLKNGPLGDAEELEKARTKPNFKNAPDIMGAVGDHGFLFLRNDGTVGTGLARPNSSAPNTIDEKFDLPNPVGRYAPLNASPLTYNKCPEFIKELLIENTANVRTVFNASVQQLGAHDNTLPQIDKYPNYRTANEIITFIKDPANPQKGQLEPGQHIPQRPAVPPGWNGQGEGLYSELAVGLEHDGQNHRTHGNIGVKDVEFFNTLGKVGPSILDAVDEFLERDDWELCVFKKTINYFNPKKNTAVSENESISRALEYMTREFDDDGKETISTEKVPKETDLFGNAFTSEERMAFKLKVPDHKGQGQDGTFKLYTVEGQLGSGKDPELDPIVEGC
tara:strand:- start:808 stop:2133 length:1326 start_codon:yes stop_codon:yes gene_type:complete